MHRFYYFIISACMLFTSCTKDEVITEEAVSYTHLDVYKRQLLSQTKELQLWIKNKL